MRAVRNNHPRRCGQTLTLEHAAVGVIGDCEHVRGHFMALLALVQLDHLLRVDGQAPVRIHHHAEQPRVRL